MTVTSPTTPYPASPPSQVGVRPGPLLLADVLAEPDLAAHRRRLGDLAPRDLDTLVAWCEAVAVRGRGGAGFPFAIKLRAAAGRRPLVVVNGSEGEPASHKDSVLLTRAPHLVLDGAAVTARALGTREVHVVLARARPEVVRAVEQAVSQRRGSGERLRWRTHLADDRFVAGQARAVLELMAGRENLPVTAWTPEAVSGHRGRPTLLSNAETFAHVATLARIGPERYAAQGHPGAPGTVLLTVDGDGAAPAVVEVAGGSRLVDAVGTRWQPGQPLLIGGYHGTWMDGADVVAARLDRTLLAESGFALGAGVLLPLAAGTCPLPRTARIVRYLAGESAGRCGPCRFGLPALADELDRVVLGRGSRARLDELAGVVTGRGACAHPDGTARLVRSMLECFPHEVAAHGSGRCDWPPRAPDGGRHG
jgi:NADH:ubiquinone oxidoreductase subunit F (NADH-binding)